MNWALISLRSPAPDPEAAFWKMTYARPLQTSPARVTAGQRIAHAMAERVTQSWTTIPHFHTTITVDMSGVVAAQTAAGKDFTFTDFIARAVAQALAAHTNLNGYWKNGTHETVSEIHIGLVVQTERGLVIPTLRDARALEFAELAAERAQLVSQAHAGKIECGCTHSRHIYLVQHGAGEHRSFHGHHQPTTSRNPVRGQHPTAGRMSSTVS